jgi:hypothetical protein
MVIVCLLGGLSVAAWAQDEPATLPTPVTGTVTGSWGFSAGSGNTAHTEGLEDGVLTGRGYVEHQEIAWSDPRLPSDHWIRMDYAIHGSDRPDLVMTVTTSHLLLGEEGSWRGTGRAVERGTDERYATYELVGDGAYEGLYLILQKPPGPDTPGPWDLAYEGLIFEGALPAFPAPAEPLELDPDAQHFPYPTQPPGD